MAEQVLRFTGRVTRVERELIPHVNLVRIEDEGGEYVVEMDAHEEVLQLREGDRVVFRVERRLGSYRDGVDFVGRATVASMKREDGGWAYLLSIGGLLVLIHSRRELDLAPTEKVYVVVELSSSGP